MPGSWAKAKLVRRKEGTGTYGSCAGATDSLADSGMLDAVHFAGHKVSHEAPASFRVCIAKHRFCAISVCVEPSHISGNLQTDPSLLELGQAIAAAVHAWVVPWKPMRIVGATRSRRGRFVHRALGLVDLHSESVEWNLVVFHWIYIP